MPRWMFGRLMGLEPKLIHDRNGTLSYIAIFREKQQPEWMSTYIVQYFKLREEAKEEEDL